jgi:hypothetical protein
LSPRGTNGTIVSRPQFEQTAGCISRWVRSRRNPLSLPLLKLAVLGESPPIRALRVARQDEQRPGGCMSPRLA